MMNNKWIEIAGLPGVGKTTLIEKHISFIQTQRKIIQSRQPSLKNRILAKIYLYGWTGRFLKNRSIARSMAYRLSFRFFENSYEPALFYDSGLIQFILEILIYNGDEDLNAMLGILKKSEPPSTLIYLTDDIDKIAGRELARMPRRYPDLSEKELVTRYKNAEEILKKCVFPLIRTVHMVDIHDETDFLEKLKT